MTSIADCSMLLRCVVLTTILLMPEARGAERQATPPESIRARDGFRVELLCSAQEGESSWISMTFDPQGRIIVGLDDRGIARLTVNPENGQTNFQRIPNTENLAHIRGVLYAHDALYVSATDSQGIYRMRDLGDSFSAPQKIQELRYNSRYGHGTNQLTLGPDQMLYLAIGNDVVFPPSMNADSPYRNPQNDWLLPSKHDGGHDNRVGYVVKFDPEGNSWEVIAGGFRNQVDIAFNDQGEMFTWDADMEWDLGLPWYRPTRLNHVVSGGEYGWRWGTGKWPDWFPDSLPSTLDTGLGSPTAMQFGDRSNWPAPYRTALFMADWQFGRILMVEVKPQGASYIANAEWFLEGGPLNVCDLTFGPDGALYFITGGRGSQSGLYRVTWTGDNEPIDQPTIDASTTNAAEARQLRHQLEIYQRRPEPTAVDFIWEHLGHEDRWIRFAARAALENQPVESWRNRLVESQDGIAQQVACLALARVGEPEDQAIVIDALLESSWDSAATEDWLLPLRTLQVSLSRHGVPNEVAQQKIRERLEPLFPQSNFAANWLLQELLVSLRSPQVLPKSLALIQSATSQEEQIQYAKTLTQVDWGWDEPSTAQVTAWLSRTRNLPGGKLVATTWQNLRNDFSALWDEPQRLALAAKLDETDQATGDETTISHAPRMFVSNWAIEDLIDEVNALRPQERSLERGEQVLAEGLCLQCHRFGQRGSPVGPDLTLVGKRFDGRALLESILEPSRQVDPKYFNASFLMDDGRIVTGRTLGVTQNQLTIETNPLTAESVVINRSEIEKSLPTTQSPMPSGLLDTFTREEILDLIALLRR